MAAAVSDDLFRPFPERDLDELIPAVWEVVDQPRLPSGRRPHGLTDNGLVRTTGWLRFRDRTVDSGLTVAVIGLLVAIGAAVPMVPAGPVAAGLVVVLLPSACYGIWRLARWLRPAATARTVAVVSAGTLAVDSWVRVYGSIGPVAQVASSESDSDGLVRVRFRGGTTMTWPRRHLVHLVELADPAPDPGSPR